MANRVVVALSDQSISWPSSGREGASCSVCVDPEDLLKREVRNQEGPTTKK